MHFAVEIAENGVENKCLTFHERGRRVGIDIEYLSRVFSQFNHYNHVAKNK